jgi:hypothetical protein
MGEITLDKSKSYSENRGDCMPDDPHYGVCFWQGGRLKGTDRRGKPTWVTVLLPFDAQGQLVPDDGKTQPWDALDAEGKKVKHWPLWNDTMRALLKKKQERIAAMKTSGAIEEDEDDEPGSPEDIISVSEEVNIGAWLRGEVKYEWAMLQAACRKRYSRQYTSKEEMVVELILDERVIPEDQVALDLRRYLPARAA